MFKRYIAPLLLAAAAVVAGFSLPAVAQVIPSGMRSNFIALFTNATATGATAAVRGVNQTKTYEVTGSTTAGTGSASITIEGANGVPATSWVTIGTTTLTLGTAVTAASIASTDRFTWLRGNVTAISGTGASVSGTVGF